MSTADHYGRVGAQGPILSATSRTYPDYGAIEAALTVPSPAVANYRAPYDAGQGLSVLGNIIGILILIPFTLIGIAICIGILSALCGACIVTGHWLWLHLSSATSPYSEASLWSTFLVGFWGSAATLLPFSVLNASLKACFMGASDGVGMVLILNVVLGFFKVGFDCVAGVPLVGYYYGIETLGLTYALCAAYTGGVIVSFVLMMIVPR
ncbi:uncharacterized protein EV420DRAFT_1643348 [Desarmillaria tabescens]|uniref:Uncharacterized protein n=1 Tax=Armillaria tabescens TaxID=1929756 RepID=A0AA39N4W5_ARMTA|nr:uncharacterized protein EV420DRAFT_1643348 [Desarmillaria tabescens]KAK0457997.1 hypothetical protein EV420DRAFT_1643348 [Desarmillaria tabescens]